MNYFKECELDLYKKVLKEIGLKRKTEKFWDYLFETHLVPEHIILEYASAGSKSKGDVFIKQINYSNEYSEKINTSSLKKMLDEIFREKIQNDSIVDDIDIIYELCSEDLFLNILKSNSRLISYDLSEKLLDYCDINELYKLGISNEILLNNHIAEFDMNLFYEFGFRNLSARFIDKYFVDKELLNMMEIEVDNRPNIGIDKSPLYENGGICLSEMHTNGVDIYIPFGLWCNLFTAINISCRCMGEKLQSLKETAKSLNLDEEPYNSLKISLEEDIKLLEQQKMLLENFSNIKYEI